MASTVFPAAGGGVTQKVQEFLTTGTFTVPSNVTCVEVFMVGGGGGGGSTFVLATCSGGGGGGGTVVSGRTLLVTAGASYTVTIGAGGAGSTANGTAGSDGGDSSFGSLLTVPGGGGGGSVNNASGRVNPRSRGTQGGQCHTSNSEAAQSGGGAAPIYIGQQQSTTPQGIYVSSSLTSITNPSNGGQIAASNDERTVPGLGIEGFGGGGWGGRSSTTGGWAISYHGGAISNGADAAGLNGTVNKGGGGGGASGGVGATRNGGNGGSGYARITYWS